MNSFIEEFRNCWEQQNIPGSLFIINQIRNDDKINYICFVEGTTDINFYKNINNIPFSNKEIYYIHMLYKKKGGLDISNELIGKKGIITNYFKIKDNKTLNKSLNKCIFIVDHDYDGLVDRKLDDNECNNFTITEPYAFENYFLSEDNLKEIFKLFNISDKFDNFFKPSKNGSF